MPLTLPSHAAAVLPFMSRRTAFLPPSALVVGSTSPDLLYAIGYKGAFGHQLVGVFGLCLPVGLLAYVWAELALLPLLARRLPVVGGVQLSRFTVTRGLPRDVGGWLLAALAVALGALTHITWDGFTHRDSWPSRELYPKVVWTLGPVTMIASRWLQHTSTIVGAALVLTFMSRRYRSMPRPDLHGTLRDLFPLLLAGALCSLAAYGWIQAFPADVRRHGMLWTWFWTTVRFTVLAWTVIALWDRRGGYKS